MRKLSLILGISIVSLLLPYAASAADWRLMDMGVGIWDDSAYDTQLKVVEKRESWTMDELVKRNAFAGRGQVFGAWIVGPPLNTYLNKFGTPIYSYKYRLTDPKGGSMVFGPHGFYQPGFTAIFLNVSQYTGTWKIDWMLHNRETGQDSPIGSQSFQITQAPAAAAPGGSWKLIDKGVGIYDDSAYDTQLKIVEKGDRWSLQDLVNRGALRGRGQVFGAWLVGPPLNTYLNKFGTPIYSYKYRLTDPKGGSQVFGPHGFYQPGFTTIFLNVSQYTGTWKIDWMLHNRETGQDAPLDTVMFTIVP